MVLLLIGNIYYLAGSYAPTEESIDDMLPSSFYPDQQNPSVPPSTQLTHVPPLPVGWEKADDPESGSPFYFNRALGVSQWDPPAIPPPPFTTLSLNTPLYHTTNSGVTGASSPVDSIPPQTK